MQVATPRPLELVREQILGFRQRAQALDERMPMSPDSLRRAAWAGLQDSVPRAALHSIHARVEGTTPSTWGDPAFVQLWGPRFTAYVVPAQDVAPFSLGRLPDDAKGRQRAEDLAERLDAFLDGRRMSYWEAGKALGGHPNQLRYAAATGRVLIRWEGARRPTVWTVPAPDVGPADARQELARRYLHTSGPGTPASFAKWAGIGLAGAKAAFTRLGHGLTPVRTPIGDAWILGEDEASFREPPGRTAPARLLPSGDPYFLFWGADRDLIVPEPSRRDALWTSRVWPGAVLVGGEIVGTWRRADAAVTLEVWRPVSSRERAALEAAAESLPLPGTRARLTGIEVG